MRSKIDSMTNYLHTDHGAANNGSRLQAARSNEKYPPQPAGHNFATKYAQGSNLSQRRTSSTQDLNGKNVAAPNQFTSNRGQQAN